MQQEGFQWPWSVGGGWEAVESSAAAVSCGQIGGPSYLLCIADILAQWAVSTPRHFIHMGQPTVLQTSLSHYSHLSTLFSLSRQINVPFVSFYTHSFILNLLTTVQQVCVWPCLIKPESFFMAQQEWVKSTTFNIYIINHWLCFKHWDTKCMDGYFNVLLKQTWYQYKDNTR